MRALRNIPVLVGIARDMESVCDDAWLLNITNPMTALCRAVTRETNVQCVGLCHEVTMAQFTLSQLLDAEFTSFDFDVVGVNHLPLITGIRIDGKDALPRLRALLDDPARGDEIIYVPPEIVVEAKKHGIEIEQTKRDVMQANQVKLRCFERFGALPAAGDRHLVEFFPGFLTEASDWGKRWGVSLTSIADREADAVKHKDTLEQLMQATEVPSMPSGEMVAPMIDAFLRDKPRTFPLNLPNAGQVLDLPADVVVEAMVVADGEGLNPRDELHAPPLFAEWLRRIVSSQEATVEAALTGDRGKVAEAMVLDPLAGRIDIDDVWRMADEMITATKQWLPQFA
jgi:alpha-galactosidase